MNFVSKQTIKRKILESKEFRDAFVLEHIRRQIPYQIRAMRKERDWSQITAGEVLGKPQAVISRYESRTYGKMTLQTLLEIASGFDCGLLIKFVPFSRLVKEYEDVSPEALSAPDVTNKMEIAALNAWAMEGAPVSIHKDTTQPNNLRRFPAPISTNKEVQKSEYIQENLPGMLYPRLKLVGSSSGKSTTQQAATGSLLTADTTESTDRNKLGRYATRLSA